MHGRRGLPRVHRDASTSLGLAYNALLRGDPGTLLEAIGAEDPDPPAPDPGGATAGLPHTGSYAGAEAIASYLHEFAERWDELLIEAQHSDQWAPDQVTISGIVVGRLKGSPGLVRAWFVHHLRVSRGGPVALRVEVGIMPASRRRYLSSRR